MFDLFQKHVHCGHKKNINHCITLFINLSLFPTLINMWSILIMSTSVRQRTLICSVTHIHFSLKEKGVSGVGDSLRAPSPDDVFWGAWSTLTCATHQRRTPRDALTPRAARLSPALPRLAFQPPAPSHLLDVISPQSRDRFFPRYPTRPCLFYPGSLLWMCWTWSNPLENGDQFTYAKGLLEESQQQKKNKKKKKKRKQKAGQLLHILHSFF